MVRSAGNRRDAASHNQLGAVGVVVLSAVTQLAIAVVAHDPEAAIALDKQTMVLPGGNLGHGLRAAGDRLQQHRQ